MATQQYVTCHLERAGSTQDEARRRFVGSPLLVTAATQEAGRGRMGSRWVQAPRAVVASLALSPAWPPRTWPRLGLSAGLAARGTLGAGVALKWPNDLLLGERKIGGILTEADDEALVVGFGANLWWPEPVEGAAALYEADPGADVPRRLAEAWAVALLAYVAAGPDRWGRNEYLEACATIGRRIVWEPAGTGLAVGIDDDGALVVETAKGTEVLHAGEVHTVR